MKLSIILDRHIRKALRLRIFSENPSLYPLLIPYINQNIGGAKAMIVRHANHIDYEYVVYFETEEDKLKFIMEYA